MKRLGELAKLVGGTLNCGGDLEISGASRLDRAGQSDITFVTTEQLLQQFLDGSAAAAVIPETLATADLINSDRPCLFTADAEAAFVAITVAFRPPVVREPIGISTKAMICPTAQLADDVTVHAGAIIMSNVVIGSGSVIYPRVTIMENCQIGNQAQIFPGTTLYENTIIGERVILHAGVVLGANGFGYKTVEGQHQLSAQLGNVVLGDDVEVGANSTIDRGTYDSTTIGDGTKIDNLVMIGHNCQIGQHNLLCSQVGIAGSTSTGHHTVMGGQVGLKDHLKVGSGVTIAAKSGLIHDVADGQTMFGYPARPARETMQMMAHQAKLPTLRKEFRQLQKQLKELQAMIEQEGTSPRSAKSAA